MSLMLAVVLAGIGTGGLMASGLLQHAARFLSGVSTVAFLAAFSVPISYRLFGVVTTGTQIGDWRQVLWLAIVMTGATSLLSGVLLTLLAESVGRQTLHGTRATAWLLLANTIGAMCGPLVAAFLLLPGVGMERALFGLTAVYLAVGGMAMFDMWGSLRMARARWWSLVGAGAAAVVLITFPSGLMARYTDRIVGPYKTDGSEIIASREGPAESILLMRRDWLNHRVYDRLVTNGFSMSGTATSARRYMRYFAYWPMMLHAAPLRRALLICYGVGVTAGALTDIQSLETIDVVETSPDIVAISDLIYTPTEHPLRDRRVRLHLEDGRYFLETAGEQYDLITGEPPPPRTPGAVNIYTREYFRLIRGRLAEGGIATYWLPVARPNPGTDVNTIIRAFCDVFADCSLWNATPSDFMLVGTRDAIGPVASTNFTSAWRLPRLATRLRDVGFEAPEQIGATFLGDATYLRTVMADAPPLIDDFPQRLRPVAGRPSLSDPRYSTDPSVIRQFEGVLDPARARQHFAASPLIHKLWPPDLVAATLPFFEYQRIVNRILWEGARPLRHIEDLHELLTSTSLETLPLWLLGDDDTIGRIAEGADAADPTAEYVRALSALARRDYAGAASRFERAEALGVPVSTVRSLLVYALCLGGRKEAARARATGITPRTPDEQHFWSWIASAFAVGPFAHVAQR
jgi:predicted membrane-bound spermidine synthase